MSKEIGPGTLVGERFRIEQIAGSGGMGVVYRAHDGSTASTVALKVLTDDTADAADRFAREARVLSGLDHPAIVRHVAHGKTPDGSPWLAMEWLEGEDLAAHLARQGMRISETMVLAERLADALGQAHALGVVHRDIKPSNVFLPNGDPTSAKLLDFGIARPIRAKTALTRTGTIMGTPGYMAPEQIEGTSTIDPRADVFSFGAVLFECLTGKQAFPGEHVMAVLARLLLEDAPRVNEFRPDVPEGVVDLIARMLARDKELRPMDGLALRKELSNLGRLTGAPPAARSALTLLTAAEQRFLCMVVVLGQTQASADNALGATVQSITDSATVSALKAALSNLHARIDELPGALLVSMTDAETPADQAARAAQCALRMRAQVPWAPMIIVTGRGDVSGRLPIGLVVDRAASFFGRTKTSSTPAEGENRTAIWVDDMTKALLDVRFDIAETPLGAELLGEREIGEWSRTLLGKATPCVGRERELAMLEGVVEASLSEESAHAVIVTGPPGIGKTRLRHEIVRRFGQRFPDLSTWVGRADQIRAGSAHFLLGSILRHAAKISGGETIDVRREKLRTLVSMVRLEEPDRITAFLGEITGESFSDEALPLLRAARVDAAVMASEVRRAFEEFMDAMTQRGPVCLVLEDVHWADAPSMRLLDRVLGNLRERPFCVVALARPEVHEVFPRIFAERQRDEMRLSELSRKAAERLVKHALGDQVDAVMVAKIVERAAGNAFVLEELIRAVAERRDETFPESVIGMVQARLASLSNEERLVLRAASIFGETFWASGVGALAFREATSKNAVSILDKLAEREFLRAHTVSRFAGEREYAFRHALIREAAHAMLTDVDRTVGHGAAAAWLERLGETDSAVLAEHWELAGQGAKAANYWARAAEGAIRADALALATAQARRGIALQPNAELLADLHILAGQALAYLGDLDGSTEHVNKAVEFAQPGSRVHTLALAGVMSNAFLRSDPGPLVNAIPILLQVEPTSEARDTFAWALNLAANALMHARQKEMAKLFLDKLQRLADSAPEDELTKAWCADVHAFWDFFIEDDPYKALQGATMAVTLLERHGQRSHAHFLSMRVAGPFLTLGANERVEIVLAPPAVGGSIADGIRTNCLMVVAMRRGEFQQAISEGIAVLERCAKNPAIVVGTTALMFLLYLEVGDLEKAEESVRIVLERAFFSESVNATLEAALALGQRDFARAISLADKGIREDTGPCSIGYVKSIAYLVRTKASQATNRVEEARATIADAREWLLARAARIQDAELQKSFFEGIPEHAEIMALSSALGA